MLVQDDNCSKEIKLLTVRWTNSFEISLWFHINKGILYIELNILLFYFYFLLISSFFINFFLFPHFWLSNCLFFFFFRSKSKLLYEFAMVYCENLVFILWFSFVLWVKIIQSMQWSYVMLIWKCDDIYFPFLITRTIF